MMKLLVGTNLPDDQLRRIVRKTLLDAHEASAKLAPKPQSSRPLRPSDAEPDAIDNGERKQGAEEPSLPGLDLEQFSIAIGDLSNFDVVIG